MKFLVIFAILIAFVSAQRGSYAGNRAIVGSRYQGNTESRQNIVPDSVDQRSFVAPQAVQPVYGFNPDYQGFGGFPIGNQQQGFPFVQPFNYGR